MLVLSRKVGEKLVIDGNVTVELVRIKGNRIALGISAPKEVVILRGELEKQTATVPDFHSQRIGL
ncbi:MAG: carbon storage regulator [Planctomycetales bacterium]|nr:carbon storage regulator [Planctomycetales bacterium]